MSNDDHYIGACCDLLRALDAAGHPAAQHLADVGCARDHASKINILRAIGHVYPQTDISRTPPVCEAYPGLSPDVAARIVLDMEVGPGLTRSERHRWLSSGAKEEAATWLLKSAGIKLDAKSVPVARWVISVCDSEPEKAALYRHNRWGSLSDHTADLTDEDVAPYDDGSRPGVHEVTARREARMVEDEYGTDPLADVPDWLNLLNGRIKPLVTGIALAREGREMGHCVGGYVEEVRGGRSVICAVSAFGERATVEFDRSGKVVQIKGKHNTDAGTIARHVAKLAATHRPQQHRR